MPTETLHSIQEIAREALQNQELKNAFKRKQDKGCRWKERHKEQNPDKTLKNLLLSTKYSDMPPQLSLGKRNKKSYWKGKRAQGS